VPIVYLLFIQTEVIVQVGICNGDVTMDNPCNGLGLSVAISH